MTALIIPNEEYMLTAIVQAKLARDQHDYAIGAVIVNSNGIVSCGINGVKRFSDATCHAEILAIRAASKQLLTRHLHGCVLYTTHEPCPMCTAASIYAELEGIVYGANVGDMKEYSIHNHSLTCSWRTFDIGAREIASRGKPEIEIVGPFMREECLKLFHSD